VLHLAVVTCFAVVALESLLVAANEMGPPASFPIDEVPC
jgi:hypothetical protein